jgi:NADH-ubiquinone oxidoreductase chain 4
MLTLLLLVPLIGIFAISATSHGYNLSSPLSNAAGPISQGQTETNLNKNTTDVTSNLLNIYKVNYINKEVTVKLIGLITTIINLVISIVVFILFHLSSNVYQFVGEYHQINSFDIYLGVDGMSIYFVLLTTIIMPIALLSN